METSGKQLQAAFTARVAVVSSSIKQEWNYLSKNAKQWNTFHQQPLLYCNMQGELLIRLASGLQVNSGGQLQNLEDGLAAAEIDAYLDDTTNSQQSMP